MNSPRLGVVVLASVLLAILCGTVTLYANLAHLSRPVSQVVVVASSSSHLSALPVQWVPNTLTFDLLPGDVGSRTVVVNSNQTLTNIVLEPVPEISQFLLLQPMEIASFSSGGSLPINVEARIPATTQSGTYEGTIHLKTSSSTVPEVLKITINVGLPPDPGITGSVTLAGIDSDANGVRDDVQRYIGLTYPNSAKERAALSQAASALQTMIVGGAAQSNLKEVSKALDCLNSTFMTGSGDVRGLTLAHNAYLKLRTVVANTPARGQAYFTAEDQFSGTVTLLTPYSQQPLSCLFPPSSFPN